MLYLCSSSSQLSRNAPIVSRAVGRALLFAKIFGIDSSFSFAFFLESWLLTYDVYRRFELSLIFLPLMIIDSNPCSLFTSSLTRCISLSYASISYRFYFLIGLSNARSLIKTFSKSCATVSTISFI